MSKITSKNEKIDGFTFVFLTPTMAENGRNFSWKLASPLRFFDFLDGEFPQLIVKNHVLKFINQWIYYCILTQKNGKNGRILFWKFANPQFFFDFSGGRGGLFSTISRFSTPVILKTFKVTFFRGSSSVINFECQLLSVEADHDYEIEKLC